MLNKEKIQLGINNLQREVGHAKELGHLENAEVTARSLLQDIEAEMARHGDMEKDMKRTHEMLGNLLETLRTDSQRDNCVNILHRLEYLVNEGRTHKKRTGDITHSLYEGASRQYPAKHDSNGGVGAEYANLGNLIVNVKTHKDIQACRDQCNKLIGLLCMETTVPKDGIPWPWRKDK